MEEPVIHSMDDTMVSSVFQKANQSVDDFLKEIQGDATDPFDISLPDLQQGQQQPGSPHTLPLNVDNSILLLELNGPRDFVDSPKKKVTIDSNPPVEMEFTQLSEYDGDESNSDQSLDQLKTIWEKVEPKKPWNDNNFNALPMITNSKSMPNIEIDFDSEQTMVPSPLPPHKTSNKNNNMISINKVTYDHSHYIQDMEDLKYQKYSNEKIDLNKLKNDISNLPDLKPIDEVKKMELINGFQNQNQDNDDDVKRTNSLKSIISIKETKLKTINVKKSMISIEVENSKFKDDDQIIERAFDEVNDLDISDIDTDVPGESTLNIPKHEHKRSSSLSDMVGNFIRSMSSKSIAVETQEEQEDDNEPFSKPPAISVPPSRIVSGVSVATTNTEGFVSAQENLDNSDDEFININQNALDDSEVDKTDDQHEADVTLIPNNINEEEVDIQIIDSSETDDSLNKIDKVELDKLKIDSPNSSFNSDKFVLKTSFDDDVYTNEFDEFNKSLNFKSRISSTSTTAANPKRIESFELSERNEVLNIWNTQSPNSTPPIVAMGEFDPINSPIKAAIISSERAREIRKLKDSSNRKSSRTPSEELIPSKWVLKKLEVIPNSVVFSGHSKSKSFSSMHTNEKLIVNPLFNSNEGLNHYNQLDDVDVSNGTIIHNNDYLAIKFDDSLINDRSELLNAELSTGLSDMEDSLLKIINQWDPIDSNIDDTNLIEDQSNKDILSKVWNTHPNIIDEIHHVKSTSKHISEDFEGYIHQKRIISDDFKVKSAQTGKVHYHIIKSSPIEQNGTIYNLENLSYSKLIPELGITQNPLVSSHMVERSADISVDSFKTANSKLLLTPKKQTMADSMRPQLSPTKPNALNISPAHKKMQAKMQQQMDMKREQLKHQKLQSQLQKNLREEAKILSEMYPKRGNSIKLVQKEAKEQPVELFEQFTTPVKDNPFESPIKSPIEETVEPLVERNIVELKSKLIDGERGRLFFKINGINDIKLPQVSNRNCKFQMILDNGIHRLVTDFINFESNNFINIDKEFELIVADKLDIIITLKLKYDKPKAQKYTIAEKKTVKSKSKIGRLLGRKEVQIVNREIIKEPQHDALSDWIANDGSFGKLKIDFDDFENDILGKPNDFNLKCFNEWKVYKDTRGKKIQIKSPVEICSINFKMLFIPRSTHNEILPISISNALEQVQEANKVDDIINEGFMYQDGGDLESWTRRYYKLDGFDLLAFSDLNGKLKAKINLKNIHEIISGSTITNRKFSESLKLNNGFKLIFGNDETIEFGCDSTDQMERWIEILNQLSILSNFQRQPWLKLMIQNASSV